MATARVRSGVLALAASVAAASPELRGVDDRDLYDLAAARLVGAHEFTSFSVARFANGNASRQELAELGPEALCHCGCWGADNFVACHNTAKTTVGISTFWFDPWDWRWKGRALRYFGAGSPGYEAGRQATSFLATAVLPEGPGGSMVFDVAYANDLAPPVGRSASIVRGRTGAASCGAAALCDLQCDGAPQYILWRAACRGKPATVEAWADPARETRPSTLSAGIASIAWFVSGITLALSATAACSCWRASQHGAHRREGENDGPRHSQLQSS